MRITKQAEVLIAGSPASHSASQTVSQNNQAENYTDMQFTNLQFSRGHQ